MTSTPKDKALTPKDSSPTPARPAPAPQDRGWIPGLRNTVMGFVESFWSAPIVRENLKKLLEGDFVTVVPSKNRYNGKQGDSVYSERSNVDQRGEPQSTDTSRADPEDYVDGKDDGRSTSELSTADTNPKTTSPILPVSGPASSNRQTSTSQQSPVDVEPIAEGDENDSLFDEEGPAESIDIKKGVRFTGLRIDKFVLQHFIWSLTITLEKLHIRQFKLGMDERDFLSIANAAAGLTEQAHKFLHGMGTLEKGPTSLPFSEAEKATFDQFQRTWGEFSTALEPVLKNLGSQAYDTLGQHGSHFSQKYYWELNFLYFMGFLSVFGMCYLFIAASLYYTIAIFEWCKRRPKKKQAKTRSSAASRRGNKNKSYISSSDSGEAEYQQSSARKRRNFARRSFNRNLNNRQNYPRPLSKSDDEDVYTVREPNTPEEEQRLLLSNEKPTCRESV